MKIIKNSNWEIACEEIAQEIINMETGKLFFVGGKKNERKITPYPVFKMEGVTTIIKPNFIIIVVPKQLREADTMQKIESKVKELYKQIDYDERKVHYALETGSYGFTVTKARHLLDNTCYEIRKTYDANRRIIWNHSSRPLNNLIGARITWIFYTENQIIDNIYYNLYVLPLASQLLTIFYDNGNITSFDNGYILERNLLLTDFTCMKNLIDVTSMGVVDETRFRDYPDCPEKANFFTQCSKYFAMPEFHSSWVASQYTIYLCEERKAGFEIIKHLGDISSFDMRLSTGSVCINMLEKPVYQVKFYDVVIDNGDIDSDKCAKCKTPLYNDVYGVFDSMTTRICKAYCAICLHTRFIVDTPTESPLVYNDNSIIGRFTYPKTQDDIIDTIPVSSIVKDIYKLAYRQTYWDNLESASLGRAVYLGCQEGKKFVGWSGKINNYYHYYQNIKLASKLNHLDKAKIFSFKYINR